VPETIRIAVPTREVATRLAETLHECDVHVAGEDGRVVVEIRCDREFNDLLRHVLDGAESYLAAEPTAGLRLLVEGREYPLHPRGEG
jgi:hypothetical protein